MQHRELHSLEKINIIRQLPSIPEDRLRSLGRREQRPHMHHLHLHEFIVWNALRMVY
jgi:hypothetical protein